MMQVKENSTKTSSKKNDISLEQASHFAAASSWYQRKKIDSDFWIVDVSFYFFQLGYVPVGMACDKDQPLIRG